MERLSKLKKWILAEAYKRNIKRETVIWSIALVLVVALIGFYIYSQNARKEKVIELVKQSYTAFSEYGYESVDTQIKELLRNMKGELKIYGWKARKIDKNIYFVGYIFDKGDGRVGYFFEVNLKANIVRRISGDPDLKKKYGINQ